MLPLVSLILLVRNRDRYLSGAIESVLSQTYPCLELVIWDDGSTDRSLAIAQAYAQRDRRVRVLTAPHQGIPKSRQAAIAHTHGGYLGWVDSDDLLAPTAIAETVAVLEGQPQVGMVYTDYQVIDAQGQSLGPGSRCQTPYSPDALLQQFITFHFRLLRRSVYDAIGGINTAFPYAYDYDLCLRLSEATQIYQLKRSLYFYRHHRANNSHQKVLHQSVWARQAIQQAQARRQRRLLSAPPSPVLPGLKVAGWLAALPWLSWSTLGPAAATPGMIAPTSPTATPTLLAQAIIPAADGTGTIATPQGNQITITGGQRSGDGANLFHSFQEFGVAVGDRANFIASPEVHNILGRVTGGQASMINGILAVTGAPSHLYLINPAGILFGSQASLDLAGSFTATTATGVWFGPALLRATGETDYATLLGSPSGWQFAPLLPGAIANLGTLAVNPGQALTLLGGTVAGGTLAVPQGQLIVASVPGQSTVRLSQPGQVLSLEIAAIAASANHLTALDLPALLTGQPDLAAAGLELTPTGAIQPLGASASIGGGDVTLNQAMAGNALLFAQDDLVLVGSELGVSENLTLQALDTLYGHDRSGDRLLLWAGQDLVVQGHQAIDLFALAHPDSGLVAGGNLTLRSAQTVGGDAHYWSGGHFRIETLNGDLGGLASPYDPVIRATGDVAFDSYTGVSLHVIAGGSITVTGDITITGRDLTNGLVETGISLSDGTVIDIDGTSSPTLDLRAGTTNVGLPGLPLPPTGLSPDPPTTTPTPSTSDLFIGGTITLDPLAAFGDATDIQVYLTNQYFPNPALNDGNITVGGNINAEMTLSFGSGRNVVIDSRGSINTNSINAFVSATDIAGDVTLLANQGVTVADISTYVGDNPYGAESGDVRVVTQAGDITLGNVNTSILMTSVPFFSPVNVLGGDITLLAPAGAVTAGGLNTSVQAPIGSPIDLIATAGAVTVNALGTVNLTGINTSANANNDVGVTVTGGAIAVTGDVITITGPLSSDASVSSDEAATATAGDISLLGTTAIVMQDPTIGVAPISATAQAIVFGTQPATATAGDVSLAIVAVPSGSDRHIQFGSIRAEGIATGVTALGTGGNITVRAPNGRVQGLEVIEFTSNTMNATGTTTGGTIAIEHDGGTTNEPFVVGGTTLNGTVGSLTTNSGSVTPTTPFPLPGTIAPLADVTITFNNLAPALNAGNPTVTATVPTPSITFTVVDLLLTLSDGNDDLTTTRLGSVNAGTLTFADGTPVLPGTVLTASDVLVYTFPPGVTDQANAIAFVANDRLTNSSPVSVRFVSPVMPPPPVIPPSVPPDVPPSVPPDVSPPVSPDVPPAVSPEADRDASLVGDSDDVGPPSRRQVARRCPPTCQSDRQTEVDLSGEPLVLPTVDEAQAILQDIARQTGVRPALLYIGYVPSATSIRPGYTEQEATQSEDVTRYLGRSRQTAGITIEVSPAAADELELLLIPVGGTPVRRRLSGVTRAQVQQVVNRFQSGVSNPGRVRFRNYQSSAEQLYDWLIAPIEAELVAHNINNIAFILDGGLRSLPMAALHDGEQYLIERYSMGLMPSLSLVDTEYLNVRNTQVLAMGTASFPDQSPLPAVPVELQIIVEDLWLGQRYLDEDFTSDRLRSLRTETPYGIVHLATHGEFLPGDLSNSYIQFRDRRVSLTDLDSLGLNDPPTELLVLSACRTVLGNVDAELGFAGSALQAGTKSVLGSYWHVSDEGTLALMAEFYRALQTAPIKAIALQQAQIDMLRGNINVQDGQIITTAGVIALPPELTGLENLDLSHPFYWSAFTLVGSPW